MNARKQKMLNNPAIPTANDRLRALREIEKRSRECLRVGGCRPPASLSEWLAAEREIEAQLVQRRSVENPVQLKFRFSTGGKPAASRHPAKPHPESAGYAQRRALYE